MYIIVVKGRPHLSISPSLTGWKRCAILDGKRSYACPDGRVFCLLSWVRSGVYFLWHEMGNSYSHTSVFEGNGVILECRRHG